ncbi:MAG TPA: hypothetical protein VLX09_25345, partial [Stellaceae bacterium]|nr:hypothetical protein [Stellaceae bacterium]
SEQAPAGAPNEPVQSLPPRKVRCRRRRLSANLAPPAMALAIFVIAGNAGATEWSAERLIDDALSAAPPSIARAATVMDWNHRVLRQGNGVYFCFPTPQDTRPRGREPMCLDKVWMAWLDAWMYAKPFKADGIGVAYMLAGDAGASAIDPYAAGPTADNRWAVDGPHLMIILPDTTGLEGLPTDASSGGPWVMWKGTPYAHIMVPVGSLHGIKR